MSLAEAILRRVDDGRPVTFLGDQSQEVGRRQLWELARVSRLVRLHGDCVEHVGCVELGLRFWGPT